MSSKKGFMTTFKKLNSQKGARTEVAEELSFSELLSLKKPPLSSEYIPNNILVLWIKCLQIIF